MARFDVFEALPDVWCVRHRPRGACAYIVKTSPGAVVIDAGPLPSAAGLMAGLQRARVGLASVRALVITHWHSDQSGGASALKTRAGTPVLYSRGDAPFLTGKCRPGFWNRWRGRGAPSPVAADRFLEDGARVEDCLEVRATPGHTPGHLSFYLERDRALFAGDAPVSDIDADWILPAHGEPIKRRGR